MGSNVTLNPQLPTLAGTTVASATVSASVETCTVTPTTAQSSLNFSKLVLEIENQSTTASVTVSLGAADDYSSKGQGAYSVSIATAQTRIVGGDGFESARFQDEDGYLVMTFSPSTATCIVKAYEFLTAIRHA